MQLIDYWRQTINNHHYPFWGGTCHLKGSSEVLEGCGSTEHNQHREYWDWSAFKIVFTRTLFSRRDS